MIVHDCHRMIQKRAKQIYIISIQAFLPVMDSGFCAVQILSVEAAGIIKQIRRDMLPDGFKPSAAADCDQDAAFMDPAQNFFCSSGYLTGAVQQSSVQITGNQFYFTGSHGDIVVSINTKFKTEDMV